MLKGRGRDPRGASSPAPGHFNMRPPALAQPRTPLPQRQPIKPEPDYEVVEFPSDQYVNAKLQPPPPPPPRPPTGHPTQAGASCGLCGGGGARVRCAECGRRALCASCDDMYHRHPKRRHHQRQALSLSQLSEDRPPLPPKTAVAPVPPPRRHKMSASPKPPLQDLRHATLGHGPLPGIRPQPSPVFSQPQQMPPVHIQNKMAAPPGHIGSMPFLNTMPHQGVPMQSQIQTNTMGHFNSAWNRPRGSLQGFNMPQMASGSETWESSEMVAAPQQGWGRPLRRGASVLELGGAGASCAGCAHCAPVGWRYGSCASLDHPWAGGGWPASAPAPACCAPHHQHLALPHPHHHAPQTPQPYRRADSRTMSRAASRAGSRAASPALSVRSRASRRNKHRTPSPPPLPSSDADSETEEEEPPPRRGSRPTTVTRENAPPTNMTRENASTNVTRETASTNVTRETASTNVTRENESTNVTHQNVSTTAVTALSPPNAPWQCEHCTYVNEPGVRVCAVCCRTPTTAPQVVDVIPEVEGLHINSVDALPTRVRESPRMEVLEPKRTEPTKSNRERTSTGCGPSPPRERASGKATPRLVTPTREQNGGTSRHDMAVGPSPPRDVRNSKSVTTEAFRESNTVRVSPYRETKETPIAPQRHSISVGPSPPRHSISVGPSPPRHNISVGPSPPRHNISVGPSPPRHHISVGPSPPRDTSRHNVSVGPSPPREPMSTGNFQKKSAGTSPPRDVVMAGRPSASITKTNVSNTGTSPPPQSISTQTYEDPSAVVSGAGSAARARRRLREDARRERSRSRHSLSSDTRESERSVRTVGGGWEWRERDVSPPSAAEWGRLARRASHLDLRRTARPHRRSSFYGSEAASPEPPPHGRAASVEALAGGARGLQLARLLADAERLGYDAAEVQVALEVSPEAPLDWLRTRWAGLTGAVRGAAARLAPHAPLSEREARAALARHRGGVWPAVTECVDALRRQTESGRVSSSALVRGRVWGSPAGAEAEAAPRACAEYSSDDEHVRDEWLDDYDRREKYSPLPDDEDVARTLHSLRARAAPDDSSLLRDLLADAAWGATDLAGGPPFTDFIQSENDFIDAYNALTRASPLPNIGKPLPEPALGTVRTDHDYSRRDDKVRGVVVNENVNKPRVKEHSNKNQIVNTLKAPDRKISPHSKHEPKKAKIKVLKSEHRNIPDPHINPSIERNSTVIKSATITKENQRHEIKSPTIPLDSPQSNQAEEKPSNLNDMVDNTQKLIQQMKDEINSDINSLDDGHAQTSQSEHESSSNDEREESSYSETEEETDNMTSDEKEISSEGEYEEEEIEENKSKNDVTFPNRTSSEDNEQFEEALDNLDNQIEDVKHANIEILDSIARSLQEEHVMTIEVNDPKPESVNIIEEFNDPKSNNFDNNEYTINNNKINERNGNILKKEDTNNNLFVAVNSFDEIYAELSTSINKIKENQTEPSQPATKVFVEKSSPVEPKMLLTKHAVTEFILKTVTPTHPLITENRDPIFKATLETTEETESEEDTVQQVQPETTQEHNTTETVDDKQLINGKSSSESSFSSNQSNPSQNDDNVVEALNATEAINTENIEVVIEEAIPVTTMNINANAESFQIKQNTQRDSVEKVTETLTNESTNKTATAKSNIPKPVKTTQNIKAKVDKLTPKLIVSKVPIRRTSVKQYPAPAPPKTHFGNVQIGHVKQLQSKIFNNAKPAKPPVSVTIDVKPSTSTATLTKKKPAPPPPGKQPEEKQPTPPKSSPPKDKRNNYFRETCRTEDEWTDSDLEDSQSQIVKPKEEREEEPISPPSPPPPITLRRVSGQIIDLANVQLPEGSPERQARLLLAGGALETWEQARLAVELVARGAAPPAALLAALECADLSAALAYLHQDCELCATRLPEHEMVSMLRCTHRCCRECARLYFTVQVTERSIVDCVCPYCKLPELETLPEDAWLDYFAHLDILLKALLDPEVHELFQRKLRDRTLARDPNFRWCMECSSGFFVHPKQKKLRCPECRSVSCASCRKPWSPNHEGLSCEQYAAWLEDNDPERSAAAVQQHLRENGLECPRCRFKYSLSRGGCMHFTCTQCKFEFCYGCGKPFMMGARCGLSEYCAKLGLHAHHPRNCLFYLRDKEPHELQTLLQMNNVPYETKAAESGGRCPIQLQRETPAGLVDGVCGSEAPDNYAGLCKNHYLEYLSRVVRARCVDPLPLLAVDDLETLVRRAALRPPPRPYGSLDGVYRRALTEIVREKIPLD